MTRLTPYLLLVLLLAACSGPPPSDEPRGTTPQEATGDAPEETTDGGGMEPRPREILSGNLGGGPRSGEVRIAFSAEALSRDIGERVPDRGDGAYVAALWGRKTTGGYTMSLAGSEDRDGLTVLRVGLEEPPEDAMVTQAITYPYLVAFVPGAPPEPGGVVVADRDGRPLDWPVVVVGGGG